MRFLANFEHHRQRCYHVASHWCHAIPLRARHAQTCAHGMQQHDMQQQCRRHLSAWCSNGVEDVLISQLTCSMQLLSNAHGLRVHAC